MCGTVPHHEPTTDLAPTADQSFLCSSGGHAVVGATDCGKDRGGRRGSQHSPFHAAAQAAVRVQDTLITTAGVHLHSQTPFDMDNADGDATYRELPAAAAATDMTITHKYYDHRDADQDLNVVFPLAHFRDLVERGVIGSLGPRHFGFMGHIEGSQTAILTRKSSPDVAAKLRKDGVDFAFLTPA